jgi:hypothetical protein
MEDALDEHRFAVDSIDNPVTAMHLTPHTSAVFAMRLPGPWVPLEQVENRLQAPEVFIGDIAAKFLSAEIVNLRKIAPCRRTELDFSHAARGAQR